MDIEGTYVQRVFKKVGAKKRFYVATTVVCFLAKSKLIAFQSIVRERTYHAVYIIYFVEYESRSV